MRSSLIPTRLWTQGHRFNGRRWYGSDGIKERPWPGLLDGIGSSVCDSEQAPSTFEPRTVSRDLSIRKLSSRSRNPTQPNAAPHSFQSPRIKHERILTGYDDGPLGTVSLNNFSTAAKMNRSTNRRRANGTNNGRRLLGRRATRHQVESVLIPDQSENVDTKDKLLPVSAVHIAKTIDLFPVVNKLFAKGVIQRQMFSKNALVVRLPSSPDNNHSKNCYIAVYRFGAVVAINLSPLRLRDLVEQMKQYATDPVPEGFERKEHFGILLQNPRSPSAIQQNPESESSAGALVQDAISTDVTGDYCVVPELDMNGVSVISNIMAQTVALDTYNDTVDELLAHFSKINAEVSKTGKVSASDKADLFKTVSHNNSIFIDMISKIRIKDRSHLAWNLTKYESIHYGLKVRP